MLAIKQTMRNATLAVATVALLGMSGCAGMDAQQQRMLTGGAAGTAIGAAGTVLTGGCVACGAAIGGAVGVAGGYIVDQMDRR